MKKITILCILLCFISFAVFSAQESDDLTVKLEVTEDTSVAWFIQNKATLDNWNTESSSSEPAVLSAEKLSIDVYPSVNTNKGSAVTIYVYGTALVNGGEGKESKIPLSATGDTTDSLYVVTNFDGGSWSGPTQETDECIKFVEKLPENGGAFAKRVLSPKVTLSVNPVAYSNATAYGADDPYEATLTMQLDAK